MIKPKTRHGGGFCQVDFFVTEPGFEPRLAESESDVLPLHYSAIMRTFLVTLLVQNSNFLLKDLQLLVHILAA